MEKQKQSRVELVAALCRANPTASTVAISKRLHNEHPALFPTFNIANCAVRHCRGERGKKSRKPTKTFHVEHLSPLPEAHAEAWKPYELDARKTLALSDIHLPYHSPVAIEAALKVGDSFNPDAIFINGDLFDFHQISRFDRNPTLPTVGQELLAGGQFFDHVRQRFPKAKIIYKWGNHCERWASYLFKVAPLLSDVPGVKDTWLEPAGIIRNKVQVVYDGRPVMLGKLPVLHGHELGGGAGSVNPARAAFLKTNHTVLIGHFHRTSGHGDSNLFHDEIFGWSTGCLCDMSPAYARVNKWNWGFATVTVHRDGGFDVNNMRIAKDGKVRAS